MGSLYRRKTKRADGTTVTLPTWWMKYRQNGKVIQESSETRKKTVAQRMLDTREGDIAKGIPVDPKVGKITFDDAATDLVNDYTINKRKSQAFVEQRIGAGLRPVFGRLRMVDITTSTVRAYARTRQEAGLANATMNRELAALKRMFSLAVQAGKLHGKPYIPMLKEDNVRKGFFEDEQFDAVLARLPAPLQALFRFANITGWRTQAEIVPLEWRQVDWGRRLVRLDPGTTKNREGRTFYFTADLEVLLKAQQAEHERLKRADRLVSLVFHRDGKPIRNYRGAWRSACVGAGVPGRIPHDFRRTAVRRLVQAGVPERVAMTMTGHKTRSVFDRYHIVSDGDQREAAAKLDRLAGTVSGTGLRSAELSRIGGSR